MRFQNYIKNCQLDLRLFFFLWLLMALYRIIFMLKYAGAIAPETVLGDIGLANFAGMRLSLKSAGGFTLLAFVFATLPELIFPKLRLCRLRLGIGALAIFLLTVLFLARFPYYEEFRMTYGLQVFQGWHDDRMALLGTMVSEYGLIQWLLVAVVISAVLAVVLKKLLSLPTKTFSVPLHPVLRAFCAFLLTFSFMFFCRWGGGVSYATGINWENASVTGDSFLNECVLDDVQAMYRAINQEKQMQAGNIYGVDKEKIKDLTAEQVQQALQRTAPGARIAKPKHIFIILGESWAQWPMLDKYADLHVADGIKSLIAEKNSYYTPCFMPNGDGTSVAIAGMITGLVEVSVRPNYQPRSYKEVYPTALSRPFHELGYQVDFWYGGTPDWDNVSRLALAQGFDHFYGYPHFRAPKTNPWGTNDRNLFTALKRHLSEEAPTVHLIMTTSNHPPYNIDLAEEGFDVDKTEAIVRELIPDEVDPHNLAVELGHYRYMDQVVTEFIRDTEKKYPDSIFVITGDHAVRSNPGAKPTMFEFQSVPFVLYGAGITHDILPERAVGGHIGIMPTLVDLIAPDGFNYASVAPAVGQYPATFNRDYYLTDKIMGQVNTDKAELLPGIVSADIPLEQAKLDPFLRHMRTLSYWLLCGPESKEK